MTPPTVIDLLTVVPKFADELHLKYNENVPDAPEVTVAGELYVTPSELHVTPASADTVIGTDADTPVMLTVAFCAVFISALFVADTVN